MRLADSGEGARLGVAPERDETDPNKVNMPTALVTLHAEGRRLGTWMASLWLDPQPVTVGDKTYLISLRFRRYYTPYTMHLIDFTHERYPGTDTPKDFSSRLRLVDPARNENREVVIYMNNPLRYNGETFYQAGFLPGDAGTVLQVVDNPGAWIPYVSCVLVGLGMTVHFGLHLVGFLRRRLA